MHLTEKDNLILQLCRAGIWNEKFKIPTSVEWKEVFDKAITQGIGGIVCDAINNNQDGSIKIDTIQLMQLIAHTFELEANYNKVVNAIQQIAALCEDNQIKMLLFKGYALSLLYPRPEHRPMGDVDFYCFGNQPKLDALLEKELNIRPKKSSHHTIFNLDGVEFENHITLFEDDCHRSNRITEKDCQEALKVKQIDIRIGNTSLFVPNPNLNALFITRHSSGHFATENIQIRHLLDWAFFVKTYHEEIDWLWLMDCSKRANMHKFLAAQNTICIKYLSFKKDLFPSSYPEEAELAGKIITEILHPRFSKEIPSMQDHFFKYCILKTKRLFVNRWKYKISFKESLFSHFWGYSTNRLRSWIRIKI